MRWPWQINDVPIQHGASRHWAWLVRYMIPDEEGDDYVRRLRIVQTPWFGIYLHDIIAPDEQDLHDHPWWFMGVILRGGYAEEVAETRAPFADVRHRVRRRWSIAQVRLDECHRITYVMENTRTLILVGPRVRDWGFYTEDGWVFWKDYQRLGKRITHT